MVTERRWVAVRGWRVTEVNGIWLPVQMGFSLGGGTQYSKTSSWWSLWNPADILKTYQTVHSHCMSCYLHVWNKQSYPSSLERRASLPNLSVSVLDHVTRTSVRLMHISPAITGQSYQPLGKWKPIPMELQGPNDLDHKSKGMIKTN